MSHHDFRTDSPTTQESYSQRITSVMSVFATDRFNVKVTYIIIIMTFYIYNYLTSLKKIHLAKKNCPIEFSLLRKDGTSIHESRDSSHRSKRNVLQFIT